MANTVTTLLRRTTIDYVLVVDSGFGVRSTGRWFPPNRAYEITVLQLTRTIGLPSLSLNREGLTPFPADR